MLFRFMNILKASPKKFIFLATWEKTPDNYTKQKNAPRRIIIECDWRKARLITEHLRNKNIVTIFDDRTTDDDDDVVIIIKRPGIETTYKFHWEKIMKSLPCSKRGFLIGFKISLIVVEVKCSMTKNETRRNSITRNRSLNKKFCTPNVYWEE